MKKKLIALFVLLCLVGITGCTKNNGSNDIKNYLENTIGIKNYTLSNNPTEKKDSDGYTDYYWHVKYKNIEFDIIDDYHYGMESVTNSLKSDYNQKVMDYHYSIYSNKNNITYKNDLIYGKQSLICDASDGNKIVDSTKLQQCYNNIVSFISTIDFNTYPMSSISVEVINGSKHIKWLSIVKNNKINSYNDFNI